MRFETKAVHTGQSPDPETGAVIPPIHLSATFAQEEPGVHKGFEYARTDNPTRRRLEEALAVLENGKYALAFASGMAAISAIMNLLKPGDHVFASEDLYGGTYRLFEQVLTQYGLEFSYVDTSDLEAVRRGFKKGTRMLWLETPTNPLLKICDIKRIAELKRDALVVVDNTFASPYLQTPLDLGADIVVHSTTKYLAGHSDVLGGAVVTLNPQLYEKLKFVQNAVGAVPSPFDCFLIHRGLKTLALRMRTHCQNGLAIARFLEKHRRIEEVYYPGLESHPQHELAERQMRDFGGMISFELKSDDTKRVRRFLSSLKLFKLAESLGSVASLIAHPATMTHASMPKAEQLRRGIKENLIRLSVGIEHVDDLIEDLSVTLKKI